MRSVQRLETAPGRGGVAHPRRFFVSLLVVSLALYGACAASVTERSEPGDALPLSAGLWPQGALLIKPGTDDVKNKYLPAVAVLSEWEWQGRPYRQACSGALLDPKLVITAGHCVCAARLPTEHEQRPGSSVPLNISLWASRAQALAGVTLTEIWDGNGPCASHATVTLIRYGPDPGDKPQQEEVKAEDTEVLLHPKFEVLKGWRKGAAADGVVWASADLAAIVLREPVKMKFQPLALPEKEVGVGDDIAMAGYGTLATAKSPLLRQFGDSRVTLIVPLETGSVFFRTEQRSPREGGPGSYAEAGDSGGPAVRRSAPRTLVGIVSIGATRADGTPMSLFMSAYSHKQWMQQMLRRVTRRTPSRPGAPDGGRSP